MRWRVILGLSLIANLLLALGWFTSARNDNARLAQTLAETNTINTTNIRTAVIVRRSFFSWQELESRDYPTYIKNLRAIGCPEQTIRDIIVADVNEMLRGKRLEQMPRLKPNPKWWTNIRDPADEAVDANQSASIGQQRMTILNELLGEGWNTRSRLDISRTNEQHDLMIATMDVSPALSVLSPEMKQKVAALLEKRISPRESAMLARYGVEPPSKVIADPVAAEKESWSTLASMLNPAQLEEARLRFSSHAENLREELDMIPGFNTQPEEFKKIFNSTQELDFQIRALAERDDPEAQAERQKLTAQMEAAIRAALDPKRYELYVRLRDPAYLAALESVEGIENTNPNTIAALYAINREVTAEQEKIQNDQTLTEIQREIELKKLELEQLKAIAQALGEKLTEEPGQAQQPKPEPQKIHNVISGEGLERIARIYGVGAAEVRAANPGVNFDNLKPGDKVGIPLRLMYPLPP